MKDPHFLLQSGPVLSREKTACCFSRYPVRFCDFDKIELLDPKESLPKFIPVGSVEFVKRYSDHVGISLPVDFSYPEEVRNFLYRELTVKRFSEVPNKDFVKPFGSIKTFTGGIKGKLEEDVLSMIDPDTSVWCSKKVPIGAEYRFYILNLAIRGPKILGWSRYDDRDTKDPEPDVSLVDRIAKSLNDYSLGPNGYSIDIGWRPDLGRYCLIEINDGWSLGYYDNNDPQSNPPSRQEYADILYARWTQIVFCNIV